LITERARLEALLEAARGGEHYDDLEAGPARAAPGRKARPTSSGAGGAEAAATREIQVRPVSIGAARVVCLGRRRGNDAV
jgi:hypothetical protein